MKHFVFQMGWFVYCNPNKIESKHPQVMMKELGITYKYCEPAPIVDCWRFYFCENIPEKLPEYLVPLPDDHFEKYYKGEK